MSKYPYIPKPLFPAVMFACKLLREGTCPAMSNDVQQCPAESVLSYKMRKDSGRDFSQALTEHAQLPSACSLFCLLEGIMKKIIFKNEIFNLVRVVGATAVIENEDGRVMVPASSIEEIKEEPKEEKPKKTRKSSRKKA